MFKNSAVIRTAALGLASTALIAGCKKEPPKQQPVQTKPEPVSTTQCSGLQRGIVGRNWQYKVTITDDNGQYAVKNYREILTGASAIPDTNKTTLTQDKATATELATGFCSDYSKPMIPRAKKGHAELVKAVSRKGKTKAAAKRAHHHAPVR